MNINQDKTGINIRNKGERVMESQSLLLTDFVMVRISVVRLCCSPSLSKWFDFVLV